MAASTNAASVCVIGDRIGKFLPSDEGSNADAAIADVYGEPLRRASTDPEVRLRAVE
jgi:hypothetical protein